MLAKLQSGLTYANVMATVAVFLALGGSSYAVVALKANSVRSTHIKNGQVKRPDVARNAITSAKVADGSLVSTDFRQGQLPVGPRGATGPRGPEGPPSPTAIYQNSNEVTVGPSATEFVDVNCDVDPSIGLYDQATGGGGEWLGSVSWGPLRTSAPLTRADGVPSGWRVVVQNTDPAASHNFIVTTICAI